jgi:hypothetical protein
MAILLPNPIVKCGSSAGTAITISNVRALIWEPRPGDYTPQLVMNTTTPIDWHHPHKWLRGELHVLSEAYDAFFGSGNGGPYIVPDGDNKQFPYFIAQVTDKTGKTWTYTFTGLIPIDYAGTFEVSREVVHVYPFVGKYVVPTKPT